MDEIVFEFCGIEERAPYLFAIITARIGRSEDTIGYANLRLVVPVANRDASLSALREESLALAREAIQTPPLLAWMDLARRNSV